MASFFSAYLLSAEGLTHAAERGSLTDLERLHRYRVAHGVPVNPVGKLIEIAARSGRRDILDWGVKHKYITPEQCLFADLQLAREMHPLMLERVRTHGYGSAAQWRNAGGIRVTDLQFAAVTQLHAAGTLTAADFSSGNLIDIMLGHDFRMLDWLVAGGAAAAIQDESVFLAAMRSRATTEWYMAHINVADLLEHLSPRRALQLTQMYYGYILSQTNTHPCMLWYAVRFGDYTILHDAEYCVMLTRENCMAHNGRVLRALAKKKRLTRWKSLVKMCRLSPSDFAGYGLRWPAVFE
jgi:hypothetical protein